MRQLSRRLEIFTGLKILNNEKVTENFKEIQNEYVSEYNAEKLQIGIYPPGGVFLHHLDTFTDQVQKQNLKIL